MTEQPAYQFDEWRRYLTGVAYRMLGSVTEAEDVVQDAYLRWHDADHLSVSDVRAYLTTVTSRLCLDRLRSAHRQRETYVGPWLPEPLLEAPDTSADAEALASDVSFALMLALERLSPLERAAFLLHDVFGLDFGQVAVSLNRSEASCRQLASRARKRVQAERPRYHVTAGEHSQLTDRFFDAARSGDVSTLKVLLTENATLHTDGGGKRIAARRLIFGADKIARFFEGLARKAASSRPRWVKPVIVNGRPGWLTIEQDGLPQVTTLDVADNRVQALYIVRNPDKLRHLADQFPER
ncbi:MULTISPECIES: sigma-70 family RNA polymerase sigma factor [Marinobacter]|uniref:sigma-70 family RNA polymerase sigma factor n=1 Tax=Marinobacter TaxID=2742 RepID=UPI00124839EF|nr:MULTISPECIES: sigma-70 family RNA polymerase sigma factor [Marinobacter]MBL3555220.1 sigma-70 family RNA polymerase sigma factor [Marinobacter sp. JB05H06]